MPLPPAPPAALRSSNHQSQSHLAGRLAHVRSAIVTGSSSGIGRSIATSLAAANVGLVVCADLDPQPGTGDGAVWETDPAEQRLPTHELIETRHGVGKALFVRCNVTRERAAPIDKGSSWRDGDGDTTTVWGIADVVEAAVQRAGCLDVLINNAGVGTKDIALHELDQDDWDETLAVNGRGPFLGSKHAIAQFLKQEPDAWDCRGSIINVSGIGGIVGHMKCAAFCASEATIIGLSRATALEYARQGIRCNCLLPGYIHTPMLMPWYHGLPEFGAYLDAMTPAGRLGRPSDIAGAAVWLASSRDSSYVTGITLPVDGGFTAR